jgi:alginate O-acetyltransferase complex protein AlgI
VPILIGASVIFYAWSQLTLLLLLFTCLLINVVTSHLVIVGRKSARPTYAALGVVFNVGVLVLYKFYKYGPLIVHTIPFNTGSIGAFIVALPPPLGISFFTFHGITLLVDTFHARSHGTPLHQKEQSLLFYASKVSLYFLFFPQLVAGPITKSRNFLPQVGTKRFGDIQWEYVFRNVTGLFPQDGHCRQPCAADFLDQLSVLSFAPDIRPSDHLVGLFHADIRRLCRLLLDRNRYCCAVRLHATAEFQFSVFADSFADFWRRWHISLASLLKEYLYIPLGGNRRGYLRTYFNLFVVMLLGGVWHGAAWSYMVWGGAHGVALAGERMLGDPVRLPDKPVIRAVRISLVFAYVTAAWLLFKLPDFGNVVDYVRAIWHNTDMSGSSGTLWFIAIFSIPVAAYHFIRSYRQRFAIIDRPHVAPLLYGLMIPDSDEQRRTAIIRVFSILKLALGSRSRYAMLNSPKQMVRR